MKSSSKIESILFIADITFSLSDMLIFSSVYTKQSEINSTRHWGDIMFISAHTLKEENR